jgi:transcriptional regulator with XRE-family HTH domain
MAVFKNLAGKIRDTRKRLGLMQDELSIELSSRTGRQVSRGLVARWESNLERSRTTPHPDHLFALAHMTKNPWQTLFWFMDDAVPPTQGVEYRPDGTRLLEPMFSAEQLEGFDSALSERDEGGPNPEFAAMVESPRGLERLRKHFEQLAEQERQKLAGEAMSSQGNQAPQAASKPNQSAGIAGLLGGLSYGEPSHIFFTRPEVGIGALRHSRKEAGLLTDAKLHETPNESDFLEQFKERQRRNKKFWDAVKWELEGRLNLGDKDHCFSKTVTSGLVQTRVDYLEDRIMVGFISADEVDSPFSETLFFNTYLPPAMGNLLLAERMGSRSFKKAVLIYTTRDREHASPLIAKAEDFAPSLKLLRFTLLVAAGHTKVAEALANFIERGGGEGENV